MNSQIQQMSEYERNEIINYGIKRIKVICISTLGTIVLGWMLGICLHSVIFWFSLNLLRQYAGGYHADTERQCYFISSGIIIVSLLSIKSMNHSELQWIITQIISLLFSVWHQ